MTTSNGNGHTTDSAVEISTVRDRFAKIRADLSAAFRERDGAVECILLAALSGSHALLVGPPGTAKSALFYGFLDSFRDARKFQTLVTKFGTEDEYFGPVKLSALKADQWERNLDGRLAAVECAFLDEVFKGSDSVLNTLLSAMNERLYKGQKIPLRMLVGASNELPEEEILAAVYDRFLLRDVVDYIQAEAVWMDLLLNPPTYSASVQITLAEWEAACADVQRVALPTLVVAELAKIRTELAGHGVVCSDRRWIALTRVLRAAAWLDGEKEVHIDHLQVLRYGLWNKPEDRAHVQAALAKLDRSTIAKAQDIIDQALRAYEMRPTDSAKFMQELPKLAREIKDAAAKVQRMIRDGEVSKRAAVKIAPRLAELGKVHEGLKREISDNLNL